jgi:nitrogen fixation protein FixH
MKRGWQWPVLVTAALLFTVGVNVVMLFAAGGDPNGTVVEPDYYRKAVEWDRTMARRAASDRLAWTSAVSLGAAVDGRRELLLTLRDSAGVAVRDADVTVTLIHNLEASTPLQGALSARGEVYAGALGAARSGQWEVRVEARRGAERYTATMRAEAP